MTELLIPPAVTRQEHDLYQSLQHYRQRSKDSFRALPVVLFSGNIIRGVVGEAEKSVQNLTILQLASDGYIDDVLMGRRPTDLLITSDVKNDSSH